MKGVVKMTCTCELVFGKADMNDSGILFNHRLTLYENFRPVLVMERKPGPTDGGALIDTITFQRSDDLECHKVWFNIVTYINLATYLEECDSILTYIV
jgi:hypothetical protein